MPVSVRTPSNRYFASHRPALNGRDASDRRAVQDWIRLVMTRPAQPRGGRREIPALRQQKREQ
jgi:hypothetical protein